MVCWMFKSLFLVFSYLKDNLISGKRGQLFKFFNGVYYYSQNKKTVNNKFASKDMKKAAVEYKNKVVVPSRIGQYCCE